jgi:hypothetical protein
MRLKVFRLGGPRAVGARFATYGVRKGKIGKPRRVL